MIAFNNLSQRKRLYKPSSSLTLMVHLGPYGFSFLFYQRFMGLIKNDFMALVREFESGEMNVVG